MDPDAARQFIAAGARVLDRRRYERLFEGGPAEPVRDAVRAHRNPDGGLGHALEPDARCPGSQPGVIAFGLRTLHEADAWDDALVAGACDYLAASEADGGGAIFVDECIAGWPAAPWWQPQGRAMALVSTGQIAGPLHARGVEHPWLERATEAIWRRLDTEVTTPYELLGAVRFLDHAPDRDRAAAVLQRHADALRAVVTADPEAPGETHSPLEFAPAPDSPARAVFDAAVVDAHLDHLDRGQRPDGGWTFNWLAWNPVAEAEWRGSLTVDALVILRANGRA